MPTVLDKEHLIAMDNRSRTSIVDPNRDGANTMKHTVDPKRFHQASPHTQLAPMFLPFTHNADYAHCAALCGGDEGDPLQSDVWEAYGPPVAGQTAIHIATVPAGGFFQGVKWDVVAGVAGLKVQLVYRSYDPAHGATADAPADFEAETIIDMDKDAGGLDYICNGFISPVDFGIPLVAEGDTRVYTACNGYVFARIQEITDPLCIKMARFQFHTQVQCTNSYTLPMTAMELAALQRRYPSPREKTIFKSGR